MKIMIVVGARPNFMKVAPILQAMAAANSAAEQDFGRVLKPVLVHTGQHYDATMSDAFFSDLGLPKPDVFLRVGSGSHAVQTSEIMRLFERVLLESVPDVLVVVGDVNSTLACALVAAKSNPRPVIAHVEAGLRSFDRNMPEESNRVVTDHLSDLLFVTEPSGLKNLIREGIAAEKVFFVGNTMIDSLLTFADRVDRSHILGSLGLTRSANGNGQHREVLPYALLTLHRPANVDSREAFLEIIQGLQELASSHEIVFPAHPRTQSRIHQHGLEPYFRCGSQHESGYATQSRKGIRMIEPQGYLDFVCLMKNARLIITDSGGIQEESICLGVPCVTVRENTERPVTLAEGMNVLAGVRGDGIERAVREQLLREQNAQMPELWDGKAAGRIVEVLASLTLTLENRDSAEERSQNAVTTD
jgi:UDP-N-acetylglucosamine 2-epimerase (non-hydrolysing)